MKQKNTLFAVSEYRLYTSDQLQSVMKSRFYQRVSIYNCTDEEPSCLTCSGKRGLNGIFLVGAYRHIERQMNFKSPYFALRCSDICQATPIHSTMLEELIFSL